MYHLNEINIESCPEMVMRDYWEEFQVTECNYIEAGLLKDYFSLTKIGFNTLWEPGKIKFTPADRNYGLMLEKELADNLAVDIKQSSRIIPSQKCLVITISDLGGYMVDRLSKLAEKLSAMTEIVAPPWGTVEAETYVSGKRIWYFKIYFPIK